jgi:putative transposase
MSNPFRYFNTSPEVIRLVVMMYVRYPLSLRNVEDLLAERGIDISHETVRFWWNRFGPMFAAEIRKRRVAPMRGYPQWRWHLDEVFVKINGKLCYLWRALDHEGEALEAVVTARRDKAAALKLLKRIMKNYGPPRGVVTDRLLFRGNERNWRRRSARGRWPAQQSGGEFSSAVSPTRARDAAVSKYEDAAEIQFSSRPGPESFQSGAASHHPAGLQAETLDCIGGVARTCRVGRRLRAGVSSRASVNPVTLTTPLIHGANRRDRADGENTRRGPGRASFGTGEIDIDCLVWLKKRRHYPLPPLRRSRQMPTPRKHVNFQRWSAHFHKGWRFRFQPRENNALRLWSVQHAFSKAFETGRAPRAHQD